MKSLPLKLFDVNEILLISIFKNSDLKNQILLELLEFILYITIYTTVFNFIIKTHCNTFIISISEP